MVQFFILHDVAHIQGRSEVRVFFSQGIIVAVVSSFASTAYELFVSEFNLLFDLEVF